ncbi:MAG: riboflavin synthase [Chitinophagales bacterium]|nr:riboflavin synthase [Chitinophagales bacterium]MBP9795544.1 riboflavin synthase [Chitinophagales bacterium]
MFTGIIETTGKVISLQKEGSNLHITIQSSISDQLSIDQSVSHNGVCLTVVKTDGLTHTVTAIQETLLKSNLQSLAENSTVNLERCLKIGDRLDGHMVQGHVDTTAQLINKKEEQGSYMLTFIINEDHKNLIVEKGSICLNGISLTLVDVGNDKFSVAIIPYTWQNTNLQNLNIGDNVNIEFDVIGKYVNRIMEK